MIISKIALNNYRLYQGVNEIEFKIKNGKNISESKNERKSKTTLRRAQNAGRAE